MSDRWALLLFGVLCTLLFDGEKPKMKDEIRIRLSLGLLVLAAVHAALFGIVVVALHDRNPYSCDRPCEPEFNVPIQPSYRPGTGEFGKLPEPPRVNYQAQGELKQQTFCCPSRNSNRNIVRPAIQYPVVTYELVSTRTNPAAPTQSTTQATTITQPAITSPVPPPPKKSYQIALFVSNDAQSRQLQSWFSENSQLSKLRQACEYQVYTADNAIYRARFANIVPVEHFPVVLFQDASGGHIHAAARRMIPATPSELLSDLKQGYELYQQAKKAQKTGAVKTDGYSWDDAISPSLYLSSSDCPDGYCPVEPADAWRPGDRVRDLFDGDPNGDRNALLWLSAGEIATVALIVVAVALLGFILLRRGI